MTFAGYNAGRGRVRDWIKLRGDPRDPNVDAVDWVERIPFSETRNYVQRVIENLGVYRVRFGTATSAPAMAKQEPAPVAARPEPAPRRAASPAPAPAMVKQSRNRPSPQNPRNRRSPRKRRHSAVQVRIAPAPGQATAAGPPKPPPRHRPPWGAVTNRCEYCSNRLTWGSGDSHADDMLRN